MTNWVMHWPSEDLLAYPISTGNRQYSHRKTLKFHPAGLFFVEMTLCEFNLLPYERQLVAVFTLGTFLTHRAVDEGDINLYHLPGGFFMEVYYNTHTGQVLLLQILTSTAPLENYTLSIELPKDLL
jgi:hypothetical protein